MLSPGEQVWTVAPNPDEVGAGVPRQPTPATIKVGGRTAVAGAQAEHDAFTVYDVSHLYAADKSPVNVF